MSGPEQLGPEPEQLPVVTPRIYVASLSDYNAGRLHGVWIDAAQEATEIAEAAAQMLAASPEPVAEEVAIHDFEGFGPIRLSEYESFETVARLGAGIAQHGPAFAAWAGALDSSEWDQLDQFEDHFRGRWDSIEDYAEELLSETGDDWQAQVPEWLRPYINLDVSAFARDLSYDLIVEPTNDGGVWVFDQL